ncbi:MAG: cation:proton antiporter [Hamadaea sp.]|nr:cation:proton antiporter [Hamadaea sp.]
MPDHGDVDQAQTLQTLLLITAAAVAAPFAVDRLARWIIIPTIVLELVFGVLIGPAVLDWAREDVVISALSSLGLAVLMFMAGYEIDFAGLRGGPARLAGIGWICSVVIALGLVALYSGTTYKTVVIALALTTTALGTLLPILRDRGLLGSRFGNRVMAVGAMGEFLPIVAVSVVLTTDAPLHALLLLLLFAVVAVVAAALATRPPSRRMTLLINRTMRTSAQLGIRMILLVIVFMVWIAATFELDTLLGSFAAGIVVKLALRAAPERIVEPVESKLDAIGFGFLIPIFFVVSGINLNLDALSSARGLLMTVIFLLGLLVVRGLPVLVLHRRDLPVLADRGALALFAASALPLIVVITTIGTDEGVLTTPVDAALVAAGALSVLLYPQIALRLHRPVEPASPASSRSAEPEAL